MSIHKKLAKVIQSIFRQVLRIPRALTKKLMNWLLRSFLVANRRQARLSRAGFALPTVIMMILVVMLLTTAVLFRSFDWSKNVSNYRVNQEVANAALPALDRAKKKIETLLADQQTRGVPSESILDNVLKGGDSPSTSDRYTLADENRLQLAYDLNGGGINNPTDPTDLDNTETTTNAWRFFVDSDNNGSFDSLTIYSILFRTPPQTGDQDSRRRMPLEARALPMQEGQGSQACAAGEGTSASLVNQKGWYQIGSQIKRAFFVYVTTVPITNTSEISKLPSTIRPAQLETYKGNKRNFSALEYQQDPGKNPVGNNAVYYTDDLTITAGGAFTINGRIIANSNLFVDSQSSDAPITFRQVSSRYSCYYVEENGKIIVGGNVAYGRPDNPTAAGDGDTVNLDLFQGPLQGTNGAPMPATTTGSNQSNEAKLTKDNQSVDGDISKIAYNDAAYEGRIKSLVDTAMAVGSGKDPKQVQQGVETRTKNGEDPTEARQEELDIYFRERTRRVPLAEVGYQGTDPNAAAQPSNSGDALQPPPALMFPFNPTDGKTAGSYAEVSLKTNGNGLLPKATKFETQQKNQKETYAGDRVIVGNNLPQQWLNEGKWVGDEQPQDISDTQWDAPAGSSPRQRKTGVQLLTELGNTDRDQFWEQNAAKTPQNATDAFGGLRVVTGAGIYLPPRRVATLPTDIGGSTVVWPDTMPVIRPNALQSDFTAGNVFGFPSAPTDAAGKYRPFLQMRATAVYHYLHGEDPIACVSSFYDPTTADTARNNRTIVAKAFDVSGGLNASEGLDTTQMERGPRRPATANSNNGLTYPPPSIAYNQAVVGRLLNYQGSLVYPNGRPVNPLLKKALEKANSSGTSDLPPSEKASIDAALCALQIMGVGGSVTPTETPTAGFKLPHGTIKEVAFLDARQIKNIDQGYNPEPSGPLNTGMSTLNGNYDLPIELRQPLEVRATVLDLQELKQKLTVPGPFGDEYMLPNSGIIYASRDDALPDISDDIRWLDGRNSNPKQAAIDFHLDPTRRPNGIMLIHGTPLGRDPNFNNLEKGLTLASNLPVYVKADEKNTFNPHSGEEFPTPVTPGMSSDDFYNRGSGGDADKNFNFACRAGDPRLPKCTIGDNWRSATILSDALTLLSNAFREGYRNEGDYDLRNNEIDNISNPSQKKVGNELKTPTPTPPGITPLDKTANGVRAALYRQGFWDNNFVINHDFKDSDYSILNDFTSSPDKNSSYFNNFVTPIQRRGQFPELLMEVCVKRVVSECKPEDWVVDPDPNFLKKASDTVGGNYIRRPQYASHPAGTTADPIFDKKSKDNSDLRLLPRRVAFLRDSNYRLILSKPKRQPVILGIEPLGVNSGTVVCYTYNGAAKALNGTSCKPFIGSSPRTNPNALWFRTTDSSSNPTGVGYNAANLPTYYNPAGFYNPTTGVPVNPARPFKAFVGDDRTGQPLLVPVLQIQYPTEKPESSTGASPAGASAGGSTVQFTQWLQRASADTTFNLAMATGNNPDHPLTATPPHEGDFNGGLANLPHFLENWYKPNLPRVQNATKISGSFIQIKRSNYATAPFVQLPQGWPVATNPGSYPASLPFDKSPFNYPQGKGYPQGYRTGNTSGKVPSYLTPGRQWGFDVGLLSQRPDLFAQQFVLPPTEGPNEFFREVDRNDEWVQTLLCAKIPDLTNPSTLSSVHAINESERPSSFCQNKTGN